MSGVDSRLYAKGLRFECTGCGDCCRSRGSRSYVYTALEERRQLAKHLGLKTAAFTRKFCEKTNGFFHLKNPANDCLFLKGARCSVYAARPTQCRTFPFWPENMTAKVWTKDLQRDCPGVGRGRVYTSKEIEQRLLIEQIQEGRT